MGHMVGTARCTPFSPTPLSFTLTRMPFAPCSAKQLWSLPVIEAEILARGSTFHFSRSTLIAPLLSSLPLPLLGELAAPSGTFEVLGSHQRLSPMP